MSTMRTAPTTLWGSKLTLRSFPLIQYSRWRGSCLQSLEISFSWKIFSDGLDIVGGDHVPQRSLSCSLSQILAGLGQRHHQVNNQNCHNHNASKHLIISCRKFREHLDISRLRLRENINYVKLIENNIYWNYIQVWEHLDISWLRLRENRLRCRFRRCGVLLQGWRVDVDDEGGGKLKKEH